MLTLKAHDIQILDQSVFGVYLSAAKLYKERYILEKIENIVGDARVDQEQQNNNSGDGATACFLLIVSIFAEPECSA